MSRIFPSFKALAGSLLRLPMDCLPAGMVLPILSGRLRGKKWIVSSGAYGYWLGIYESQTQRWFQRMVKQGSVVIDMGAHVGFYSLLASELVGQGGRVIAIEPLLKNLRALKAHLAMNHVMNVAVLEMAVSDECQTAAFLATENSSMGRLSSDGAMAVETVTLDYLFLNGLIPRPDCIKMDIEGEETAALKGAQTLLAEAHPIIFLAAHGFDKKQECCDLLANIGYGLTIVRDGSADGDWEILATPRNIPLG
jgi:FkbM family methyltransferase